WRSTSLTSAEGSSRPIRCVTDEMPGSEPDVAVRGPGPHRADRPVAGPDARLRRQARCPAGERGRPVCGAVPAGPAGDAPGRPVRLPRRRTPRHRRTRVARLLHRVAHRAGVVAHAPTRPRIRRAHHNREIPTNRSLRNGGMGMTTHIDERGNIELCLYREGEPLSGIALYPGPEYRARSEWSWSLYPLPGKGLYTVRAALDGQLAPHWWAMRVGVFDGYGAPIGLQRPALLYTLPWNVPTVVWFPHMWDGDNGPHVLTMRMDAGLMRPEVLESADAALPVQPMASYKLAADA